MKILLISTWFQIIWFCAVVGQEKWQIMTMLLVIATLVFGFLPLYKQDRPQDILRIMGIFILGLTIDYINLSSGVLVFHHQHFPLWLVAMWAAFSWYAYYMRPVYRRFSAYRVAIVGSIAGALSYYAGVRLDAVMWSYSTLSTVIILMLEWFVICLIIIKVHSYADKQVNHQA